ncbi:MAG: magnesium transporter CorA family protein [Verrucomicrobia bacterium]|nr:magnesium transporter CorA family protein [Verrucomicrobiota bacterium]
MILSYRIESKRLVQSNGDDADVLVYRQPTDAEKESLQKKYDLDPFDVEAVYDADEVPRLEHMPEGGIFMIWKRPDNITRDETIQFEVSSLGILIRDGKVVFIVPRDELSITGREFKQIDNGMDCVLRVLLQTAHHYQGHLKAIKMMSQELQAKIVKSMENKYLLQMFALGESLIYYHNALEANQAVLSKFHTATGKLKLSTEQLEFLEDVVIENQQASKQAGIYSTVLSGLMDARGTIVNNNMNVLLKNLTLINVVFLPLNIIASMGGMSEFSVMTKNFNPWISYGLFSVTMVLLGWLIWWWLMKVLDHLQNRSS